MLEWADPWWLLLLPLPLLAWWASSRLSDRPSSAGQGALIHPLAQLIAGLASASAGRRVPWLWLFGCLLLILAMARPQWMARDLDNEPGQNIVFAVDVSGSMRALDYAAGNDRLSRLDMTKRALKRFLGQATHMRVAMVVFADDAMPFLPLTSDLALAASMVDEIDHSLAGERTALGDAVALSIKRMLAIEGSRASRALVLLTDGSSTAGAVLPEAAAELAREEGIRIYTVGLGTEGKVPFPLTSDQDVIYTELPLDEPVLRVLATRTGGEYFRIHEVADIDRVLARIDAMEKTRIPVAAPGASEWYWVPAIAGLFLLMLAEYRRQGRVAPA